MHFCTISTDSHRYKTEALAASLRKHGARLHTLYVDVAKEDLPDGEYGLSDLHLEPSARIISKYQRNTDALRWSLKPAFLRHLLNTFDKVIYVDNDIHFFTNPSFLFELLDEHYVLLTPHDYPANPNNEQNWLEANFRVGLYNAGFFACHRNATDALDWWADCCLYRCEKNYFRGLFDDQKYLDLLPIKFPNTHILRHAGCNASAWNRHQRIIGHKDGHGFTINNTEDLVFYHFNAFAIRQIVKEGSKPEKTLLDTYVSALKAQNPNLELHDLYSKTPWMERAKLSIWQFLNKYNTY